MADVLYSIDVALFTFVNHTLHNGLFDALMPALTDWNQSWPTRILAVVLWILMLVKGGRPGRVAALLLIPTIAATDQLSSSVLKPLVDRLRPCHVLTDVHLLVGCGGGKSFPSSHAVNTFAAAVLLSHFYVRWRWAFFTFAGLVAFSRVYVGVHYPSDVIGGALIGASVAIVIVSGWDELDRRWKLRRATPEQSPGEGEPRS